MTQAVALDRREAAAVASDFERQGWQVAVVDGGTTKDDFLVAVGKALGFPQHYGANLDALWDCLNDSAVVSKETALVWDGWETLALEDPDGWAAILQVMVDRAEEEPAFCVVLAGAGGSS